VDECLPILEGLFLEAFQSDGEVFTLGIVGGDEDVDRVHGIRIV
jgi:hypothetical protein